MGGGVSSGKCTFRSGRPWRGAAQPPPQPSPGPRGREFSGSANRRRGASRGSVRWRGRRTSPGAAREGLRVGGGHVRGWSVRRSQGGGARGAAVERGCRAEIGGVRAHAAERLADRPRVLACVRRGRLCASTSARTRCCSFSRCYPWRAKAKQRAPDHSVTQYVSGRPGTTRAAPRRGGAAEARSSAQAGPLFDEADEPKTSANRGTKSTAEHRGLRGRSPRHPLDERLCKVRRRARRSATATSSLVKGEA